jgi:hypothetical protein
MIRTHDKDVVFRREITGDVVPGVIVEVNSLQIPDVTVAIREQNGQCRPIRNEAVEVDRCQREDGLDPVRRALRLIEHGHIFGGSLTAGTFQAR